MSKRFFLTEQMMPALVAVAYELSVPQGMGFMHFNPGPLDADTVSAIVAQTTSFGCRLSMDYVRGRAVKLSVLVAADGRLYIGADRWYDHSPEQLAELAKRLGLVAEDPPEPAQAAS